MKIKTTLLLAALLASTSNALLADNAPVKEKNIQISLTSAFVCHDFMTGEVPSREFDSEKEILQMAEIKCGKKIIPTHEFSELKLSQKKTYILRNGTQEKYTKSVANGKTEDTHIFYGMFTTITPKITEKGVYINGSYHYTKKIGMDSISVDGLTIDLPQTYYTNASINYTLKKGKTAILAKSKFNENEDFLLLMSIE